MKIKRILASLISLAMIFTMIPVTSYAQLTTEANGKKAKVEMVLLTKNESGAFQEVSTDDIDKTVGSVFYVGIKTKDFGNIHEVANYNSIKQGPVTKVTEFGLNTINFGVSFNNEYVILEPENTYWDDASGGYNFAVVKTKPYDSANYYYDYVKADIQTELKNRLALPTGTDATTLINKNFNGSSYELYNTDQLALNSDLTDVDIVKGYTQSITVSAQSQNTAASFPWSGADSTYMAILQFGFIKDATALNEVPLIGFSDSPSGKSFNTLTFGLDSGDNRTTYKVLYEDKHDETATGGPEVSPQDIRTIIDFIDAPLFPKSYTVTYDATTNGGSFKNNDDGSAFDATESVPENNNATLKKGDKDISSMVVPPENKVFNGWYTAAEGGTKVDADNPYKVTEDTTLYAQYTDGYKVNFKLNAGDDTSAEFADHDTNDKSFQKGSTESILDGTTLNALLGGGNPTRTNYEFKGWYTKKENGSFDTKYEETAIGALRATTDLYAMWEFKGGTNHTLTFNKNGGNTDAEPVTVGYNDGDTLQKLLGGMPKEPTKAGYQFIGWYKNASGDGTPLKVGDKLNEYTDNNTKTTVYARWGDLEAQPTDPEATPLPSPKADAITVHFEKDGDGTYGGGTYDYGTVNDKYIKAGDPIGAMPTADDMKHATKKFDGWYTATTGGKKVEPTTTMNDAGLGAGVIVDKKVTLYPRWIDKVKLTYDLNGLTGTAPAPVEGLPGDTQFTPPSTVTGMPANYTIKAWSTEANNDNTADGYKTFAPGTEYTLDDNMTLYAIWDYTGEDKVAVTFKGNDSTDNPATLHPNNTTPTNEYTIYRAPQSKITTAQMPSAERNKYDFNHWDTTKTAAAKEPYEITVTGTVGNNANDPMDIYAIWTVKDTETPVTVNFALNDTDEKPADPRTIASVTIAKGDSLGSLMPADPTREGYGFKQWEYPTGTKFDKDTVVNDNGPITVNATWEEKVTVEYDLNGLTGTAPVKVTGVPNKDKFTPPRTANVTGVDTTKYEIVAWSTSKSNDNTEAGYETFVPGTEKTLDKSLKLYAIWNYTGTDKVEVIFNGNDTALKKAQLTPNNGGADTNKYSIFRQPGTTLSADHFPTATRASYTFNHWDKDAMAAAGAQTSITVDGTVGAASNPAMNVYAIWTVTNSEDEITISYDLNGAKTPTSIPSFTIAKGDCVGDRMTTVTPTKDNADFLGWAKNTETSYSESVKFDKTEALNEDTIIKAFWQDKVTITFNANGGTVDTTAANNSLNDITLNANTAVKDKAEAPTTLPVVTKENYKFLGWFYEESGNLVELTAETNVTKSVTVKAKWQGAVSIAFDNTTFAHDGNAHTPLTVGNYSLMQLGYKADGQPDVNNEVGAINIDGADFKTKYKKHDQNDSDATETVPTAIGTYVLVGTTVTGTDKYTEYTVGSSDVFKITGNISYVVSNNYQYDADKTKTSFANIVVEEATGTSYNPNLDFTQSNSDIKVTFTKGEGENEQKFVNEMPNEYGEYTMTIEPSDDSPYVVQNITDKLTNAAANKLYLICTTRTIKYVFGTGATPTDTTVDVTLPTPADADKHKINDVKTTLGTQSPAKALPVDGTDFTAPEGKRLKTTGNKFETRTAEQTEVGSGTKFDETTEIKWGTDEIEVFALYEDADWTITFKDTKTADKQADIVYTVESGKKISEANAVKKVDGSAPSSPVTDVAQVAKVPENMMFIGWTDNKDFADAALANSDFEGAKIKAADFEAAADGKPAGKHYGKLFTKESTPAGGSTKVEVYAIYVKSNDATLKSASFFGVTVEKDDDGNPTGTETPETNAFAYKNADYSVPDTPITFDPATETYTVVAENGFEKVLAKLEPTQSDATIEVKYISADDTAGTEQTATVDSSKTPNESKVPVDATKYDATNESNSVNVVKVTVTAPDGTKDTYTFNVLRYAKPRVELMPGNSPYGLIEAMSTKYGGTWDAKKIQDAKDKFVSGVGLQSYRFKDINYTPTNGKTNISYHPMAWGNSKDPTVNMDLNPNAIFGYYKKDIVDTGFEAYDSMDRPVDATKIKRSITVKVMPSTNVNSMRLSTVHAPVDITGKVSNYTMTELKSLIVCPGKYTIDYSFEDPETKEEQVWKQRDLVLLWSIADADMSGTLSGSDASTIKQVVSNQVKTNDLDSVTANLYKFRIADADMSGTLSGSDASSAKQILSNIIKDAEYYIKK